MILIKTLLTKLDWIVKATNFGTYAPNPIKAKMMILKLRGCAVYVEVDLFEKVN